MSSSNILRLLRDALTLNKERLPLASGDVMAFRPDVDDQGEINFGDGSYDLDLKVFLGSTSEYVLFDVGNSRLELACPLYYAPVATAEYGAGAVGTGVAPATYRYTQNGIIITDTKIDLTGLGSVATANDVIGLTGAAYIGRNVVANNGIIFQMDLICLETPAGSGADTDINVVANASGSLAKDGAGGTAYGVNGGAQAAGQVVSNLVQGLTANHYFYLTAGTGSAGTYTAGQLIVRTYGHALLA